VTAKDGLGVTRRVCSRKGLEWVLRLGLRGAHNNESAFEAAQYRFWREVQYSIAVEDRSRNYNVNMTQARNVAKEDGNSCVSLFTTMGTSLGVLDKPFKRRRSDVQVGYPPLLYHQQTFAIPLIALQTRQDTLI
jgi:hypothetical protein